MGDRGDKGKGGGGEDKGDRVDRGYTGDWGDRVTGLTEAIGVMRAMCLIYQRSQAAPLYSVVLLESESNCRRRQEHVSFCVPVSYIVYLLVLSCLSYSVSAVGCKLLRLGAV